VKRGNQILEKTKDDNGTFSARSSNGAIFRTVQLETSCPAISYAIA